VAFVAILTVTGAGTLPTDTGAFGVLLGGAILLVALLNFVPAMMLGPLVQGTTDQLF
jgi:potassium-transporting ATPase potassium-binding subunit